MLIFPSSLGGKNGVGFIRMTPPPHGVRNTGFKEARPGVAGHAFWRDAKRGPTWTAETFVDVPNLRAAFQLKAVYEALIYRQPLLLWWDWMQFDWHVVVEQVTFNQESIHGMLAQIGGGFGALRDTAVIRASWTFTAVIPTGDGLIDVNQILNELADIEEDPSEDLFAPEFGPEFA